MNINKNLNHYLILVLLLIAVPAGMAATASEYESGSAALLAYQWVGGIGDWDEAANWNPVGVPGPGDAVTIASGEVTTSGARTIGDLSITSGGKLTGSGSLAITGTFNMSNAASEISFEGDIFVGGLLTWSGGWMSGTGTTTAGGGITVSGSAGSSTNDKFLDGRRINVPAGQIATHSGNRLNGVNGAEYEIASGATLAITTGNNFSFFNAGAGGATLINRGTITKTGGTTFALEIGWDLDNHGLILIDQPDADLRFGGALADFGGTYEAASGTLTLDIKASPGTILLGATSVIRSGTAGRIHFGSRTGDGTDTFFSFEGLADIAGTLSVASSGNTYANLRVEETATLQQLGATGISAGGNRGRLIILRAPGSPDVIDVGNASVGFGGTLRFEGNAMVNGDMSLSISSAEFFAGGELTISGTLNWNGGIMSGPGPVRAGGDVTMTGGPGSASNAKVLDGTRLIVASGQTFTQNGGLFSGRNGAVVEIENDAVLDITTGNNSSVFVKGIGGATIENYGTILKNSGTTFQVNLDWDIENHGLIEMNLETGHLSLRGAMTDFGGTWHAETGILSLDLPARAESYVFGSGSVFSTGTDGHLLFSSYTGDGNISFFDIAGTVNIPGSLSVRTLFSNNTAQITIAETAVLQQLSGNLLQTGGNRGRLIVLNTDELNVNNVQISFQGLLDVSSPLNIGGTLLINNASGTLNSLHPITVDSLITWSGGAIQGEGPVTANAGLLMTGGPGSADNVKVLRNRNLIIPEGQTFNYPGNLLSGRDSATVEIRPGALLDLTMNNNSQVMTVSGGATLINEGTIRKNTGTTFEITIGWDLVNSGEVLLDLEGSQLRFSGPLLDVGGSYRAESGMLHFSPPARGEPYIFENTSLLRAGAGGRINFGGTGGSGNRIDYRLDGTLDFEGILSVKNLTGGDTPEVTIPATASITRLGGNALLLGGNRGRLFVEVTEPLWIGDLHVGFGGGLVMNGPLTVNGTFLFDDQSARFTSIHPTTVQGLMTWRGGTLDGAGPTTVNGGLTITGTAGSASWNKYLDGHTLEVTGGDMLIAGSLMNGGNGGRLIVGEDVTATVNMPGGTSTFSIFGGSTEVPSYINRGTLRAVETGGPITVNWDFINEGTIDLGESALVLRVNRGAVSSGLLVGSGTLTGNFDNVSGTVSPGPGVSGANGAGSGDSGAGLIFIDGTYTQGEAGVLEAFIGGQTAGTDYDQLRADNMVLDGTLRLGLSGGYIPGQNDVFQVATWPGGTRTGSFAAFEGQDAGDIFLAIRYGNLAVEVYDGSDITIAPPPSMSAVVNSPPFQRTGRNAPFRATISSPGEAVIFGVEAENLDRRGQPAGPHCPLDDAYENLKCRLAPFGIVPPEPEEGEEYPMLAMELFPVIPSSGGGSNGGSRTEFTAVMGPTGDLNWGQSQICETDPVSASVNVGTPVTNDNMAGCAYAIAKLALELVPGADCFKLAAGIGTSIGEGVYAGQFDLPAYLAANMVGAINCAGDVFPASKAIKVMLKLNELAGQAGGIAGALDACSSTGGSGSVAGSSSSSTTCIFAADPNDKYGPEGILTERYIASGDSMAYTVFFENKEEATAPAQIVIITDTLDVAVVDLSSFSFGMVAWTDTSAVLLPDTTGTIGTGGPEPVFSATADVDLRPVMDLVVRIDADLDPETGVITWVFSSLDPETLEPTADPLAGFLPPNNQTFDGEGLVSYFVSLKEDVPSATRFGSAARIIFDENEPIDTPVWSNILDTEAPVSAVSPLDSVQTTTEFTVSWSGEDDASGIRFYTIYVSENGGEPEVWLSDTEATSMAYTGNDGSTYAFRSTAADQVGNRSVRGTEPEAVTTVQVPTSIERTDLPAEFSLAQNYPNPFNPSTVIRFGLPEAADVRLEVYDLAGRRVAVLTDGSRSAGWHTVTFDGSALSSGVYVYRLRAGDFVQSRKLVLVK
ncbi:MAG: T9SS type A sorting domain-containing protein [Cyclonatronaceae bacterium]